MKIISYNVNGIRAALQKGLDTWLASHQPDFVCLQEIKAQSEQFPHAAFSALGYTAHLFPAEKKGYSGVAILSKKQPIRVVEGMGHPEYDAEGRVIRLDFERFSLISVYFPSGTSGEERQAVKYRFLDDFEAHVQSLRAQGLSLIVCGDVNICHKAIDIHNPVSNKNTTGFLPEERAWMDRFTALGYIDSFREFHTAPHQYTWWSYRFNSRAQNKGWRIDYQFLTPELRPHLIAANILSEAHHSDHCPTMSVFSSFT
jgi:exodeoxyribonuclease-3